MINDPYDPVYAPEHSAEELFNRACTRYDENTENIEVMQDLRAAAHKGHAQAQYTLGVMAYASLKFDEAAQWLEKSAQQPHEKQVQAQEFLESIPTLSLSK